MMRPYLRLLNTQPRTRELQFTAPVDWTLRSSETWAILGPNGAGKTILSNLIAGKIAPTTTSRIEYDFGTEDFKAWRDVRILAFDSVYGLADFREAYYQQRFHSTQNDEMPSVGEVLPTDATPEILKLFGADRFLEKKINFLSSGELRKFLITQSLLARPKLLLIDNPYIGLDADSRENLRQALRNLSDYSKTRVIFVLSDPSDIPDWVTHVLPVHQMTVSAPYLYRPTRTYQTETKTFTTPAATSAQTVVRLRNISVRYGEKQVLGGINWQIARGEKWVLTGPNGSGKSTLLSLINADHPQGYSNDISLFGRRRGSGESIWEIKKRIGYISPEMHTHYYQNIPALAVVGSGHYDTIGTIHPCNAEQTRQSLAWMDRLGITHLQNRSFIQLSSGEQRLTLLARALVKNPELLILDEPLHGLDTVNKARVLRIIDQYVSSPDITLIYVTHYLNEIPSCVSHRYEL